MGSLGTLSESKVHVRVSSIGGTKAPPSLATDLYNRRGVLVLGFVGQLETFPSHKVMLELRQVHNVVARCSERLLDEVPLHAGHATVPTTHVTREHLSRSLGPHCSRHSAEIQAGSSTWKKALGVQVYTTGRSFGPHTGCFCLQVAFASVLRVPAVGLMVLYIVPA